MIEFFRNSASSWVTKVILGVIIFSFVGFGLSGVFQSSSKANAVATVGGVDITKQQFYRELQRTLDAVQKETGKKLTLQDLYQAGLVHKILDNTITTALITQEVERLKITTPDDVVMDVIQKDPVFWEDGKFSRKKFDQILAANRLTETYYINDKRQRLAKMQLLTAISAGGYVPDTLLNAFFSTAFEKRTVSIVVPKVKVDPAKVSEGEIKKFYEEAKDKLRTPEYRSFKVLVLDPATLGRHTKITDAELKAAYEEHKESFYDKDRRDVLMIRVQDQKEASNVKLIINEGKVGTLVDAIPLKNVTSDDMPDGNLADVAFKLPVGGVSEMVHIPSMNQSYVIYVQKIIPGRLKSFNEVKEEVLEGLRQEKSMDEMANLSRSVEDKVAANLSFDQLAKEHNLKLISIQGVNAKGLLKNGKKASAGLSSDILKIAFETPVNRESPMVEIEGAPLFMVHVDAIEASAIPPLETVRDQVKKLLTQRVETETSIAKIQEIVDALKTGKKLSEVSKVIPASIHTFTIDPSDPKTSSKLDKQSVARLFSLAEGKNITISFEGQFSLGQVIKIKPANNTKGEKGRCDMVKKILTLSTNEEIIQQYVTSLREKHGVKIYEESISSLIAMGGASAAKPLPTMPDGI
jgi:peptidyl-prolyl cis-trans isomerase D